MVMESLEQRVLESKILIVDDNPSNVALLEGILEDAGYDNLYSLTNPEQVRDLHRSVDFDLILLDIRMPGIDGHEVMRQLRDGSATDYLPVLVITAQTDRETRYKALEGGAKDFINKPFDQAEILQRIRNMLEVRALYNERRTQAELLEAEVKKRTQELYEREEHLRGIMDNAAEIIMTVRPEGDIETFNKAAEKAFMLSGAEAKGRPVTDLTLGLDWPPPVGLLEVRGQRKDGPTFPLELSVREMSAGNREWRVIIGRDVTRRKLAEEEMDWLANHDPVTELPNRRKLLQALTDILADPDTVGGAVAFIVLGRYQEAIDICGHEVGEKLLREVGRKLRGLLADRGVVGAWGDGEFAAIFCGPHGSAALTETVADIKALLEPPLKIDSYELSLGCDIGLSLFPHDGETAQRLIKNASTALFSGRRDGLSEAVFFSPKMEEAAARRHRLESELRHAISRDQMRVFYQPKVDLETRRIVGMEALLRWEHPDMGMISPGQFIPVAEESGLVMPLGEWVLYQACRDTLRWNKVFGRDFQVAVNLSGRQFDTPDLSEVIRSLVRESGLDVANLELEVTESSLMRDLERGRQVLFELRDLGVNIAIDDFGTGYSSLSQLKQLPLNTLKIDRSFVCNITDNQDDATIARMIVDMARNLNLRVVAEGIETEAQASFPAGPELRTRTRLPVRQAAAGHSVRGLGAGRGLLPVAGAVLHELIRGDRRDVVDGAQQRVAYPPDHPGRQEQLGRGRDIADLQDVAVGHHGDPHMDGLRHHVLRLGAVDPLDQATGQFAGVVEVEAEEGRHRPGAVEGEHHVDTDLLPLERQNLQLVDRFAVGEQEGPLVQLDVDVQVGDARFDLAALTRALPFAVLVVVVMCAVPDDVLIRV